MIVRNKEFNIRKFETLKLVHPLDQGTTYNSRRKTLASKEQKLLNSTKSNASMKGIENTLTLSDIVIPEYCPVFGWKITADNNKKTGASVDRLEPSKGYVKGNIRVICMEANRLKNNGTIDQFEKILIYMRNNIT